MVVGERLRQRPLVDLVVGVGRGAGRAPCKREIAAREFDDQR